jgi:hypothetical protein
VSRATTIRPIVTTYNGHTFRSRLEARWAVFLDVLGVRYDYEPEAFDLGELGWYLPDFWLPTLRMWAEVKPVAFSLEEVARTRRLADGTGFEVLRLIGVPTYRVYWSTRPSPASDEEPDQHDYILDDQYVHSEHRWFGSPGLDDEEDASRTYQMSERTREAYERARTIRFPGNAHVAQSPVEWSTASHQAVVRLPPARRPRTQSPAETEVRRSSAGVDADALRHQLRLHQAHLAEAPDDLVTRAAVGRLTAELYVLERTAPRSRPRRNP